jgi:N-acetyl-anhydromuramyl-L-alanine amidase AmpD
MERLFKTYQVEGLGFDFIQFHSPNRAPRMAGAIELIVLHAMGFDLHTCLKILTDPDSLKVSAHFFIPSETAKVLCERPKYPERVPVVALVPIEEMAYHAGQSAFGDFSLRYPSCERSLNDISIGIEFHAPGAGLSSEGALDIYSFAPFSEASVRTGLELVAHLVQKLEIKPSRVLGHSDIAPHRKTDPGPLFPYKKFFERGFGPSLEPPSGPLTKETCQWWLKSLGYPVPHQASWEETEPFFKVLLHKLDCVEDSGGLWRFPLSWKRALGFMKQIKRK